MKKVLIIGAILIAIGNILYFSISYANKEPEIVSIVDPALDELELEMTRDAEHSTIGALIGVNMIRHPKEWTARTSDDKVATAWVVNSVNNLYVRFDMDGVYYVIYGVGDNKTTYQFTNADNRDFRIGYRVWSDIKSIKIRDEQFFRNILENE